jgi:hypothetical protein
MPIYEIEVTRTIEYKGIVEIEAPDENAAFDPAQAQVAAGQVALEQIYDHVDLGPIRKLEELQEGERC